MEYGIRLEILLAWSMAKYAKKKAASVGAAFLLYVVRSVISSVIPDLHVLGGIFENLGKGLV